MFEAFVFVVSTHYDGREPDDATSFMCDLKSGEYGTLFAGKKLVTFGLGDSNYAKFNQFAIDLFSIFESMKVNALP